MEPTPQDLVREVLRQAREPFQRGDFGSARRLIRAYRETATSRDRERLDAALSGYRIDPVALLVAGLTLVALLLVAAATLFHFH